MSLLKCPECGGNVDENLECARCGEYFDIQVQKMRRRVEKWVEDKRANRENL